MATINAVVIDALAAEQPPDLDRARGRQTGRRSHHCPCQQSRRLAWHCQPQILCRVSQPHGGNCDCDADAARRARAAAEPSASRSTATRRSPTSSATARSAASSRAAAVSPSISAPIPATLKVTGKRHLGLYRAEIEDDEHPHCEVSTGERRFCRKCGSALWLYDPTWPELVHPFASAIDSELPKAKGARASDAEIQGRHGSSRRSARATRPSTLSRGIDRRLAQEAGIVGGLRDPSP